jgi:hypothetical protein
VKQAQWQDEITEVPIDHRTGEKRDTFHDGKDMGLVMHDAFSKAVSKKVFVDYLMALRYKQKKA